MRGPPRPLPALLSVGARGSAAPFVHGQPGQLSAGSGPGRSWEEAAAAGIPRPSSPFSLSPVYLPMSFLPLLCFVFVLPFRLLPSYLACLSPSLFSSSHFPLRVSPSLLLVDSPIIHFRFPSLVGRALGTAKLLRLDAGCTAPACSVAGIGVTACPPRFEPPHL